MLKEKIVLEFENMKEAIKALKDEHKKHESLHEKELIKETLKDIIKKIEKAYWYNQSLIENEETWSYGMDEEYFIIEKYEKQTSAGASMYDEFFRVNVEMNTEELELELDIVYGNQVHNLIDAFQDISHGEMRLSYNFK